MATFSGALAAVGPRMRDGLQLYFDQVGNTAGGRRLEVIQEDEPADPALALQRIRKLVEQDNVAMLTGIVTTATADAARDYLHAAKQLLVIANAGGNDLTRSRRSPYVFRASFSAWQNSATSGEWAASHLGRKGYVVAADCTVGHESARAFDEGFARGGGRVLGELYPKLGTRDYGPFLPQVQAAKPDFVFCFLVGTDAVTFVQQYDQFGLRADVPLFGTGDYVEENNLPAQGQTALGARGGLHWAWGLATAENRQLIADFAAKYGKGVDAYVVQQYDSARCMVDVINRVQGDTSNSDVLVQAFEAVRFVSPRGPLEFDPVTHNVVQNVYIREVREVAGSLHNVVLDTFEGVRDPG